MGSQIDGVIDTPLKLVVNERGRLMEVQRADDPSFPGFGQTYVTQSFAGVVKAWYRHSIQVDQLCVITGLVKLVMYDDRPGSASKGVVQQIIMGDLSPRLVLIPPMVWHGFKAIGDQSAFLLHINDRAFVAAEPDEERRQIDDPYFPYRW